MKHSGQNIFTLFLDQLKVKHTKNYSSKYYEEHPHNNNLYGLSRMLSDYGVENVALRMEKEISSLKELATPYIAHLSQDFGVVTNFSPEEVEYHWKGKKVAVPHDKFLQIWSGVVLLAEKDENSIEPGYKINIRKDGITFLEKVFLSLALILLLGMVGFSTQLYKHIELIIALFITGTGGYISYLLLLKQMKVHSQYADKICSLFLHQGDCNNLLESDAAKFLGIFSWSEIGLGYFTGNMVTIVCFPHLYPYLAILNICALPYTVWSVWYQKWVAKQWCPLCLIVQAILWVFFIHNLVFGLISWPVFLLPDILLTGTLFAIPILFLNLFTSRLADSLKVQDITQKLNSIKADEKIFSSVLKAQKSYPVSRSMGILWGNPEAKNMITIVTNPHCNPCMKMHERLHVLLTNTSSGYCFQYLVNSFNEELEESSKLFIAMYQKLDQDSYLLFLKDWYENGKNNREEFYKKYPFDRTDKALLIELEKQKEWLNESKIHATPTVLFNGYELPEKYKVEDLNHFQDLEL